MRVLIACETSGHVREAFRARGHEAISCDLLPADDGSEHHRQGDALEMLEEDWNLLIAHPPCTYLAASGLHWNHRRPGRAEKTEEALAFARALLEAPIPRIALENPVDCISSRIRKPDCTIQPFLFGADASKRTCLWLKNLPTLRPTRYVDPRGEFALGGGPPRWENQTDSGQNRLSPSPDRWKLRSETYPGVAEAMAEQWGAL